MKLPYVSKKEKKRKEKFEKRLISNEFLRKSSYLDSLRSV